MRRYTALLAGLFAIAAIAAPAALADSIVFERGGNVWLANPDGSGSSQVTTSGGYSKPTQADDGTIVAVKDQLLHRMDRGGNLLNLAGDASGTGPLTPAFAPQGGLVAYNYRNLGPITPGFRTALSHSTRQTSNDEIFNIGGWSNPSWIGNDRVLMFDGSETFTGDTLIYTVGGTGTQTWFEDPDLSLVGGEVDAGVTRLAATDGTVIRLYRLSAPPPALPELRCQVSGGEGAVFRPSWSPDGSRLAWQQGDGIYVMPVDLDTCVGQSELAVLGAGAPDWGPADAGPALAASAARRVRLGALLRGLNVRVSCSCTATARLLLARKSIGRATKAVSGAATVRVRPTRAGKRRLRRGGRSVTVRVTGAGRTVTRKVRILR